MKSIKFENISKSYEKTTVIKKLNMQIEAGERLILLGPSGCGKSTVLRMISGLESITSGNLYLGDQLANNIDSGDRNIAMVFQNYALFPHMNIWENVAYGLKINKVEKDKISSRVTEALKMLELTGYEKRYPRELSGGQRQRVALARAVVKQSDFFLLDEPLSNLDAQLRGHARKELVKLHESYQQTFVYVTHDQVEAMTIGNRIALLNDGELQMLDTPSNVYHKPANIFVAKFIGSPSMNIIDAKISGSQMLLGSSTIQLPEMWLKHITASGAKQLKLGVRPEETVLSDVPAELSIPVDVRYVEDYGNKIGLYFNVNNEEVISMMQENVVAKAEQVYWNINPAKIHFFDEQTTQNIGYPPELA